eukprot:TRINITY_DN74634_c0_g1_i1.p1 TRINITY_DN74634_c0_g1~~TRINITY_DN74634_c0_g1_i1.p1  ORF type:complete len:506 (+),score=66.60 TRINITY_DN74634_c0_g1_i1:47-1564(+)
MGGVASSVCQFPRICGSTMRRNSKPILSEDIREAFCESAYMPVDIRPVPSPFEIPRECQRLIEEMKLDIDGKAMKVGGNSRDDLNKYSILGHVATEMKRAFVTNAVNDAFLNRAIGSMCGMAVGDALGHPFEFLPAQDEPRNCFFDLSTMTFHGESNSFRLKRGQWTDDAAMGLCMADSLIINRGYDGSDMRIRFWCWWNRGYNNAFRKDSSRTSSVGLGGNISKSLACLRTDERPHPTYQAEGEDAGNGSLMRLTPIPIFFHAAAMDEVYHHARMSSYTTHPGIIAAEACSFLAHLIVRALNREPGPVDPKVFLDTYTAEYYETSGLSKQSGWGYDQMKQLVTATPVDDTERCWNWRRERPDISGTLAARGRTYNGYPVSAGYFGSYSLDGVALALWAVYNTTNFDDAVVASVNLAGDADSHGSICGQLAGALYGYSAINDQFVTWLTKWDDHEFAVRALLLQHLGARRESENAKNEAQGVSNLVEEDQAKPLITNVPGQPVAE